MKKTLWIGTLRYTKANPSGGWSLKTVPFVFATTAGETESEVVAVIRAKADHDQLIADGWKEEVPDARRVTDQEVEDIAKILSS